MSLLYLGQQGFATNGVPGNVEVSRLFGPQLPGLTQLLAVDVGGIQEGCVLVDLLPGTQSLLAGEGPGRGGGT